ncbi:MAG: hypothetical protein LBB58_01345 [Cellulomonadaceae bacterium]|nr:hypothetical protein [Cellulomonadaceae bacterium]
MRVYVPVTSAELLAARAADNGAVWDLPAGFGHEVTPQLRAIFPDADDEELEWEAFNAAADDSLAMVLASPKVAPVRAIISVDIPDNSITPIAEATVVSRVNIPAVPGAKIAAVHVDEPELAELIKSGRSGGKLSAAAHNDIADAHLLWYDGSELSTVIADVLN